MRPLIVAMVGVVLGTTSLLPAGSAPAVHAAGSTPDVAIAIDVDGGGDDCDTRASTGSIGATCSVTVGNMFTVKGLVDSFTGISGSGGYGGISFRLGNSAGLTLMNRSMVTELGPAGTPYWPDCFTRSESTPAAAYEAVCHTSGPASSFIGKVVEVDYSCGTAGAQTVTLVDANTFLFNSAHSPDNSDKEGDEILTVNCLAGVGGIAELPGTAHSSPLSSGEPSSSASVLALGIAAAISATGLLGAALWRRRGTRRID